MTKVAKIRGTANQIRDAPEREVRSLLIALCKSDWQIRNRVSEGLETISKADWDQYIANREKNLAEGHPSPVGWFESKLVQGVEVCSTCRKVFVESANSGKACRYHRGESVRCYVVNGENITLT